jgi:tetratricopeptide (TPR) repeat protein
MPQGAEKWAAIGDRDLYTGQFARMRDDFSHAIELDPKNPWYWHERAYAFMQLRDYANAIADHSKAIELDDRRADTRLRRGQCYLKLGRRSEAEADFSRAIELDATSWENHYWRAVVHAQLHAPAEARADMAEAIRLCPDDPDALNECAWHVGADAESPLFDAKLGVSLAERAIKRAPAAGKIWNTLGVARYRAGDYAAALEALSKSVVFQKERAFAWDAFFLAMTHWQLGHKDEAHTWFAQGIAWMDRNAPRNEELIRFRAEAAKLVGMPLPATAPTTEGAQ